MLRNLPRECPTNRTLAEVFEASDSLTQEKTVEQIGEQTLNLVCAYSTDLKRYNVRPGKIYGKPRGKERYRIVRISGNMVFYKDLVSNKIEKSNIDELLLQWTRQGVQEISFIDDILDFIKKHLSPLLGPVLIGALTGWLINKLK